MTLAFQFFDANDQQLPVSARFVADTLAHAQTLAQSFATLMGRNVILVALDQGGQTTSAMGSVTHVTGSGGTVTLSGTPGATVRKIEIIVTQAGTASTALFSWYLNGVCQQNSQTASGSFVLTGTGLTAAFGSGSYTTADNYTCTSTTPVPHPWTAYTAGSQGSTVTSPSGISY